jgi:hypothetical protein
VYYNFQTRACVINGGGGIGVICDAWKWHRVDRLLEWGGNWYLTGGY